MTALVYKDDEGNFFIGPLSQEQYQVINDSLELATAWTDRDVDMRVARALRGLIPDPQEVEEYLNETSEPRKLFDQLPSIESQIDDLPSRPDNS